MKHLIRFFLFLFAPSLLASTPYWQCIAQDGTKKTWAAQNHYQLASLNRALEACKKQSTLPQSCFTSEDLCEELVSGVSTRPRWQCKALDQKAGNWKGRIMTNRDNAALQAKEECKKNSPIPETCYVHLHTCRNLNPR